MPRARPDPVGPTKRPGGQIWRITAACGHSSTGRLVSALGETLADLAAVFAAGGHAWYLFGAQAVAVRAAPRATQDIDVTVRVARRQLPALAAALNARGITVRYPELADELLEAGAVIPMIHPSGMEIDIVLAGSGLEDLALSRATPEVVDGAVVPVAAATDLAVMKALAGRGKDLEDLRALLATGQVDLLQARDLLAQLEEALGQSDLLPRFEQAVRDVR
jgi:hypothetical protein